MSIDKFKNLQPVNHKFDVTDIEYVNKLNNLQSRQPKRQIWAAVGTIAAAVVIVLAVGLWALIGRGIRGTTTNDPIISPPANESESFEITSDMQQRFNEMYSKLHLYALPIFKKGENPTQKAFSDYVYYITTDAKSDWIITASELNDLYFDTFGVKSSFTTGINYDGPYTVNVSLTGTELLSFTRSTLKDGTPIITLTYGEPDASVTTLSYVPISDFEPDYFIEHTAEHTVFIKKTEKPLEEESVYKVTGALADEFLSIVRESTANKDSGICYCTPTYTIVFNRIEYHVVMGGDEYVAHIVYTTGLEGTVNNKLSDTEYERLETVLAESITDKNFVEKKAVEYSPNDSEVKIVVEEVCEKYKAGTYTITGDDAKTLIRLIDEKSYVYDQMTLITGVSLQIGERYYSLNTGNQPFIQNRCGHYPLQNDTQIIPLIEKHLDAPIKTKIEDAFQTIAKKYLFDTMRDFERGTLPGLDMKDYISLYRKSLGKELLSHEAPNGWIVYGYPVEEYYTYMNELFGGYQPIEKITPISEVTGPKYYDIEAIKLDDGSLFVPIELSGGLDFVHNLVNATEGVYNGQKTVTIEYECDYGNARIQKHSVTYTTDDGINPKHFIEHKTIA